METHKNKRNPSHGLIVLCLAAGSLLASSDAKAQETLKIGALGVMSGPFAGWGGIMCQTLKTRAGMWNDDGGVVIGETTYIIEPVCVDDKGDPKGAQTGAEKLIADGIKYILGPNTDNTSESAKAVMEANGAINLSYSFSKNLYSPPATQSILGMVASYQAGPAIYEWLRENKGVHKMAFVGENTADIHQRDEGAAIARKMGFDVVSDKEVYEQGTTDFYPIMTKLISAGPDHIVLSGVNPSDAGPMIKAASELGFTGTMNTESGLDPKSIYEVAGDAANGFITSGGVTIDSIRSDFMTEFMERYSKEWGEWNEVAALYAYGPEILMQTLQYVGPEALEDTEAFKAALDGFVGTDPYNNTGRVLKYVGRKDFGQPRQVSVPLIIQEIQDGEYVPLFVAELPD